jgi:hypothetical protein
MGLGSGIRDPGSEIRDPRSGIRDPGSEKNLLWIPGVKKAPDPGSRIRIRNTAKKVGQQIFSPSFVVAVGSGIRDPGSAMDKSQDLGSGINIPDPQHWVFEKSPPTKVPYQIIVFRVILFLLTDRYVCAFLTHREESNSSTLTKAVGNCSWA